MRRLDSQGKSTSGRFGNWDKAIRGDLAFSGRFSNRGEGSMKPINILLTDCHKFLSGTTGRPLLSNFD